LGGVQSRELEQVFFGEVDMRGKLTVEFFECFDHDRMEEVLEAVCIA
jgi:hypothetical protein